MDIQRVVIDREKYPERKSFGQNATDAVTRPDDAKKVGIFLGAMDRIDDFIGQFRAQAGVLVFIPCRRFGDVLESERADDDPKSH
jgi:hypothetical protein